MQRKSSSGDASKFVLVDSEREREHDLGTRRARIVLFVVPALLLGLSILDDLAPGHDDDDMGNSFLNETLSEPKESSKLDASSLLLGLAGSDDGFSRKSAGKAARKTSREALGKSDANAQSSTASSGKGEGRRDSSHHRTESSHHRTESSHNRRSRRRHAPRAPSSTAPLPKLRRKKGMIEGVTEVVLEHEKPEMDGNMEPAVGHGKAGLLIQLRPKVQATVERGQSMLGRTELGRKIEQLHASLERQALRCRQFVAY
ncbi:hypothetical protein CYMTET_41708 [Cymbomonas tetramitiformis]|uniref:Uncharacterized protein n=1 Tax=Cymbomonas tetramitiformis TaxID=36881 RepID=A0AAE0C709_9CHLO|nr:hypothetical protein CYMTET_41708 [Cymbomonas tetramitiformis]